MKFNNIDKNNSGSISMENLHSIKSVNDFYNFYEMYGDAHSSVWFVGLEPQGHPKPDELKKNTNWPKEEAFSLGKRKKFSAYEKSCISINKLCYQLNGLDEEDLFRCNMYPLNLPQHNGKHFNNFYKDALNISFKEYKKVLKQKRLALFKELVSESTKNGRPRMIFFQGAVISGIAKEFAGLNEKQDWLGHRGFKYTYAPEINAYVFSVHHTSYPQWHKVVVDGLKSHWHKIMEPHSL